MKPLFFTEKTFGFLEQLSANNNRTWFNDHKAEYEKLVRNPALRFIDEVRPHILEQSPHFTARSKKTGGALMRVYRDIRFSHDKTPYKTNIGIQFRHRVAKDAHAPKFYLNISPHTCYLGAGAWRPHSAALSKIREMISDNPGAWKKITTDKTCCQHFQLAGESLKTYPMIHDLKRKDFIAIHPLNRDDILNGHLIDTLVSRYKETNDFMDYLCTALDLPY
ncbi:MAG: TIGR02453 family protein [Cycloclasticus sp. symbiont of Bathymodiolus heckerae]|nr:MAG: TIGR02453 family protein [Cycloclasticus sp. symbiont of Bathymodiolus heckerae]